MFGFGQKKTALTTDIDFPDAKWLAEASPEFTPDALLLERRDMALVFVYDETMRAHRHHSLIQDASVFCAGAFTKKKYILWKKNLGKESFPIPIEQKLLSVPSAPIKGELWGIRPYQLVNVLDKHKLNGIYFHRQRVEVEIPYTEVVWRKSFENNKPNAQLAHVFKTYTVRVWMYVGIKDFWVPELDSGYTFSPVKLLTPNKSAFADRTDQYYFFTPMECDV